MKSYVRLGVLFGCCLGLSLACGGESEDDEVGFTDPGGAGGSNSFGSSTGTATTKSQGGATSPLTAKSTGGASTRWNTSSGGSSLAGLGGFGGVQTSATGGVGGSSSTRVGQECPPVDSTAPYVPVTVAYTAAPTPKGGRFYDGVYRMTSYVQYRNSNSDSVAADPVLFSYTAVVSQSTATSANMDVGLKVKSTTSNDVWMDLSMSVSVSISGANYTTTVLCPSEGGTGTTSPFDANEQGFVMYEVVDGVTTEAARFERVLP